MKEIVLLSFLLVAFAHGDVDISEAHIDNLLKSYVYGDDIMDLSVLDNMKSLRAMGYKKFPALYTLYEKNKKDVKYVNGIIGLFYETDGKNICSTGDITALSITRDFLRSEQGVNSLAGVYYLAYKGIPSDVEVLQKISTNGGFIGPYASRGLVCLKLRVAGTNLIDHLNGSGIKKITDMDPPFVPSVANTGPQAEIVLQRIKKEMKKVNGDAKKLPPELLTLTIPPPQPVVERFKEKSWLIGAGVLLFAGIGGLVFWKTRKR